MTVFLITAGIILLLVGLGGALIPGLPGPPISYLGLVALHLTEKYSFSDEFLFVMAIIMIAIVILDYVVPVYGTKKFGGSKRGVWGSTIGLVAGLFVLPALGIIIGPFGLLGIILGPFIGAYIGEKTGGKDSETALRAAIGSFIGFLAGTFMKLAYAIVAGVYFFAELF